MHTLWCLWLFLALSGAYVSVLGCNTTSPVGGFYVINSQEELDAQFQNCTSIKYLIYIGQNYTGSFVLPNITTSISELQTWNEYSYKLNSNGILVSNPNLTSIVGDGVTSMDQGLSAVGAVSVTSISFPNLVQANWINVVDVGEPFIMNFPSLATVNGNITISTNISSVNFPLLTGPLGVGSGLTINGPSVESEDDKEYLPVDISFPALETACRVSLLGNISSLYIPKLSTMTRLETISISTNGNPLDINFPILGSALTISLTGAIESFSFPSLFELDSLSINSTNPLNVSLAPLKQLNAFSASGNISGLNMTSIIYVVTINVTSSLPLNCSSAGSAWIRSGWSLTSLQSDYSCEGYGNPSPSLEKKNIKLPLGLGLGIGIPVLLSIAVCAIWWRRKKRAARALVKTLPAYEMEPPPEYTAPVDVGSETHVERERSVRMGLGEGDRSVNAHEEEVDTRKVV